MHAYQYNIEPEVGLEAGLQAGPAAAGELFNIIYWRPLAESLGLWHALWPRQLSEC